MKILPAVTDPITPVRSGGIVLYVRRSVLVLRTVVKPVDPRSEAQLLERSFMAGGQRAWNGQLNQSERDTWNAS
jgi:hypothetical protein